MYIKGGYEGYPERIYLYILSGGIQGFCRTLVAIQGPQNTPVLALYNQGMPL